MALGQKQMDADIGLKMDIIAAGSIGPCKSEHRATFMSPNAEGAYWDCISNFSTQYLPVYGSKEKSGFTYYFERGGKSSWERPAPLQRIIQDGLATAKKGTDYSPDRPWETCELLSIAHFMCLQNRSGRCDSTQRSLTQCRKSRQPSGAAE